MSPIGEPAIHPTKVDLKGRPYKLLMRNSTRFLMDDIYRNPGPLKIEGPDVDIKTITLSVEDQDYIRRIQLLQSYLDKVKEMDGEIRDRSLPSKDSVLSITNRRLIISL